MGTDPTGFSRLSDSYEVSKQDTQPRMESLASRQSSRLLVGIERIGTPGSIGTPGWTGMDGDPESGDRRSGMDRGWPGVEGMDRRTRFSETLAKFPIFRDPREIPDPCPEAHPTSLSQ